MKTNSFSTNKPLQIFRIVLVLLFIITVSLVRAQTTEPYYVKSLEGQNVKQAELVTSGGSLQLLSIPGEKHRIEVYIKGNNGQNLSKSEIEQRLKERYDLTIEASTDKITAIAKQKSSWTDWKNGLSISFKVYVPSRVDSRLKTSGGSITLKGLDGNQDFATSGGSLTVSNMKGSLDGKTSGGSITVSNSEGTIDMKTSGGSLTASDCKGQIKLSTSGGSIKLSNLQGSVDVRTSGGSISGDNIGGELMAKTSGGGVRLSGIKGSVDAGTSGGSMTVSMDELGKYVKLRTSAGSIDLSLPKGKGVDLDLSGTRVNVPSLSNFSGSVTKSELNGTLNGGGIPVNARTSGGSINLSMN